VQVILDRILAQERRLQFSIVEEGIALAGKKQAKPKRGRHKEISKSGSKKKNRHVRKSKRC